MQLYLIRAASETATGVFELWRNTKWETAAGQAVLEEAEGRVLIVDSGE